MQPLIPPFISDCFAAGEFRGDFSAASMFLDISGFSAMTDALMAHGQEGAEILANIMRRVLDPLVESVYAQGGFVASFAGDAITALFPVTESGTHALRALAAAWQIQEHMRTHSEYSSVSQVFKVSAKIGLAEGQVHWGIILDENSRAGVYFFQGSAVDGCADAEHQAQAGEIILEPGIYRQMDTILQVEPHGEFYRLQAVKTSLPQPAAAQLAPTDPEILAHFFPQKILTQEWSGEFRQVVNMFINLPSVRTEVQLKIFIESLFELQEKYGGYLNRLDFGDKGTSLIMFWGAPSAYENDIERALNFILDLQMATSIPIRAGVSYRISHAGFVGGRLHMEYTCFGRGVNLAARFMTESSRGEIWVDEFIAQRASQGFEIEYLEEKSFKGFYLPQKVFLLLERKAESNPFFEGNMVGREADLEYLGRFIQPIFQERYAGMLVVAGEAGIGKSRLVHDFLLNLEGSDRKEFRTFLGQTDEILRQPFNPFRYWLRQYFGIAESQGEARNKRNFNRKLDEVIFATSQQNLADELDRTRSFLGALVGLHWPDSLYEQLEAPDRYKNTLIALTTLLQVESLQAPVILLLEDIHWLDDDSATFLVYLGRVLTAPENQAYPLVILATSRNEISNLPLQAMECDQLVLKGLSPDNLKRLVADHLEATPSESLLALLEDRAEGNPFYAEQILRYLKEGEFLELAQGAWQVKPGQADILPMDVNALLVARLDHLSRQVKETVQTAAVLGREFEVNLLSYMLKKEPKEALPEITTAEQEAIWTGLTQLHYIFIHTLMRDAAYQMQVQSRRRALHALALEAYEKLSGESLSERYGELAYHAEQAESEEKARYYLNLAGNAALEAYQNSQAADYFTRALALSPAEHVPGRYKLLMQRELVYYYQGKNQEREHDLAELAGMLPELEDRAQVVEILLRQTRYAVDRGEFPQADDYGSRAANQADAIGEMKKAAEAYRLMASSSMHQGKLEGAVTLGKRSLRRSREAGSMDEESKTLNQLGLIAIEQGKLDEALKSFHKSLDIARQTENLRFLIGPLNNLGLAANLQWNYLEAQSYYQQSLEIAQKIGDRAGEAIAFGNLGFISGSLGDYPKARQFTERYLRICREIGNPFLEANALINLSAWAVAMDDFATAEQHALQALRISQKIGDRSAEAWALTNLGHSRIALGEMATAREVYKQALSIRQELDQPELASEPSAGLAQAALLAGDLPEAAQYVSPILSHLENGGSLQGADNPLRVYLTCFLVLQGVGDPRAEALLETAYQILQERAAKIPDEAARQAFLSNIEQHRQIQAAYAGLD